MNPRHAAIALQSPAQSRYRDPTTLQVHEVCPHCNRPATSYGFATPEGVVLKTWHCEAHGDICPKRSHIANNPWGT